MYKINEKYSFNAPIFWERMNDVGSKNSLREEILRRSEETEGVQGSNREGGWQSRHNLHQWDAPGIDALLQGIQDLVREAVKATVENPDESHFDDWRLHAWANVNEKGAYNESHDHYTWSNLPLWSGIYYVDPGQSSDGGPVGGETVFELEDPIGIARPKQCNGDALVHEVTIEPQSGLMVLFPSTLRHRVEPYRGDSRRITIAWNLFHSLFHIPDSGGEDSSSAQRSQTLWHAKQILSSVSGVVRNPSILLRKLGVLGNRAHGDDEAMEKYLRDISELDP
jgi:uncharacterized protein (TIGR02466 family)